MLLIKIDLKKDQPIYKQITGEIISMIEKDILKPETILPSSRNLALKLGINRSTVIKAYEELWSLGYTESSAGSYTRVRNRLQIATKDNKKEKGIINWDKSTSEASNIIYKSFRIHKSQHKQNNKKNIVDFSRLIMDNRLFPVDNFRRSINKVLTTINSSFLNYGDGAGYYPLREFISERFQLHNINVSPEEILITNGAQQGIDLLLRLFTSQGKSIAIESPTYSMALPLFKYYQIKIIGIPMKPEGLDLKYFRNVLKKEKPVFLYTIPNFHNPTGISTSQTHREELISICEKNRIPIIEDGFEEEMKYSGKIILPIKSMDKNQIVIYLGTFSKVLFPGIRIGWIAAEKECIQRILAIKRFTDLSSNALQQAALYEFCKEGYYDLHIKKMQRIYSKRMQAALKALQKFIPKEKSEWTKPSGGYLIWIKIKNLKNENRNNLLNIMNYNGVHAESGDSFFLSKNKEMYYRLSISTLNEEEIYKGIKNLGTAIKQF